jgi:hypothetical protein
MRKYVETTRTIMNWPMICCTVLFLLSAALTNAQTISPAPSVSPFASPSAKPSKSPSSKPSAKPSAKPSVKPTSVIAVTQPPTITAGTPKPSSSLELKTFTEKTVTITLTGVLPLNVEETAYFSERTQAYIEFYYNELETSPAEIFDVEVSIENIRMNPPFVDAASGRMLRIGNGDGDGDGDGNVNSSNCVSESTLTSRNLQTDQELRITYDQTMSYRYSGPQDEDSLAKYTNQLLIQEPFNTITRRDDYISFLRNVENLIPAAGAFNNLSKVSPPELFVESEKISLVAIIAIAAGGTAFLIGVIVVVCWRKKKGKQNSDLDMRDYDPRQRGDNRILPVSDQSTLVEPNHNGYFSTDSVQGGRGPGSMATDDPDYNHNLHYGYGDQTVVSNTDGTMGDATMQSSRFSTGGSLLGAGAGGQSLFDEQSFEAYRNRGSGRREEVIEIFAPAGKLGVVIDTPDSGAPVLHRIKDTCPIADKLRIGDKLIAVDDEDVRSMTAVKVSKLISQKSANPTRKFTIMRSI